MLSVNKKKLLYNLKNWYKTKTIERCLINRTQLIEYK